MFLHKEKVKTGAKAIFGEIMAGEFPEVIKDIRSHRSAKVGNTQSKSNCEGRP